MAWFLRRVGRDAIIAPILNSDDGNEYFRQRKQRIRVRCEPGLRSRGKILPELKPEIPAEIKATGLPAVIWHVHERVHGRAFV